MKVSYWGNSISIINVLLSSGIYEVYEVIIEKKKLNDDIKRICDRNDIKISTINNKQDLMHITDGMVDTNIIVYCFGIIIPETIYSKNKVVNIHPGSLENNRGAHSILWSILIPELGAGMSAYRICCDEVDSGELIIAYNEKSNDDDTPVQLLKRLESHLPDIIKQIYRYFNKEPIATKMVKGGVYRQRVTENEYTIDFLNDTREIIKRKINSQQKYEGAILLDDDKNIHRIIGYNEYVDRLILTDSKGNRFIKHLSS